MPVTREQVRQAFELVALVTKTLHDAKEMPSGHLYAVLMPSGIDLEGYEAILRTIKGAKLIKERPDHMLVWIGPNLPQTTQEYTVRQDPAYSYAWVEPTRKPEQKGGA